MKYLLVSNHTFAPINLKGENKPNARVGGYYLEKNSPLRNRRCALTCTVLFTYTQQFLDLSTLSCKFFRPQNSISY